MQYTYQNKNKLVSLLLLCALSLSLCACSFTSGKDPITLQKVDVYTDSTAYTERDNTPKVLLPQASEEKVLTCETASVDYSNSSQGYVVASYFGRNETTKIQLTRISDASTTYTYTLHRNQPKVLPLSEGNGLYRIIIYNELSPDQLAATLMDTIEVQIDDAFSPFLYPNLFVDFNEKSDAVRIASELASYCNSDLEVIASVYGYVKNNLTYNEALANQIKKGEIKEYIPNLDSVLSSEKGICFDYASLMCAMLRSQGIPSKLNVGYTGNGSTHAWVSVYTADKGWIDGVIKFNGKSWTLMDPTTAASLESNDSLKKYMNKLPNYQLKYTY